MTKEAWRLRWLDCINELTSLDLQRKSWLDRTHTNPHWSFIEFMCCYFDELVIDDNYKKLLRDVWVTKQEYEIIKDWHQALDKYDSPQNDDYDHEAILNDPKWLHILQMGVNVRIKLAEIISETEKPYLTEKINYLKYV
jgi:hypothetical protein